ncbi:uncharacterized protein LOC131627100 [Vicia villosa]|uniref:uncharacterized protein LOC131627100 n=1 Tax=Vicia villosa TaxID=3911 RepID=UPI00273C7E46|nr:uncharacterized protein LOC131627100 [Vicia villosa]
MQSRNINGYPQQQYYDDDSRWMETKTQQLQSQGYPQTQQYPGMKPGYGNDSDYSMPKHHGLDSNNKMYYQDSKPHGLDMYPHQDSKPHGLDMYHHQDSKPHGLDSNHDVYHRQDKVPHGLGNGYGYDNNHGHGNGNGQIFPFGATANHSPQHGNGVRPFNHGGRGQNDYVSENEYEVYKEERVGSGAMKRDEMRYDERRGTYGDVRPASPYGYNNNRNNPLAHGANKANWTLKGV